MGLWVPSHVCPGRNAFPQHRIPIRCHGWLSYVSNNNALTKLIGAIDKPTEKEAREGHVLYGDSVAEATYDSQCRPNAIELHTHGWIIGSLKGHISRMEQIERYELFL